jgi:integrase
MIEYISKGKAKLIVSIGSGENRRRKSKTVTYTSKKELERMHRQFQDEVHHNPLIDTTVQELVEAYIRSRRPLGVEETTTHGYEVAAKRIYSRIGSIEARSLTSYMAQEFVTELSEKYAPKTVRNTESLLSSAYDNAVRLGQLEKNPCKMVTLPKKEQLEYDILTEEEIVRLLNALRDARLDYKVAYELALFCGMRRSEICGLREHHISVPFKTITIEQARCRVGNKDIVKSTKNETSHRHIAVPDFVLEDIVELMEQHNSVQYEHTDFLIQNGFGKPIGHSALTTQIYRIEKRAGLPPASLHDLRHTFASMLNSAHIDIAMISRELGHCNITTTLNIYTHVFGNVAESSRGIADSLNNRFEKQIETATFLPLEEKEKAANA